ncbi:hypothetical protein HIM_12435 [Hirsutella minnesotensis 3608]|uniref:EKC/KEOPS complex subunit BUD32 n=1 Tax=Hirsutella minnesotensis 3608 TaxID=1043627 RepID=A0A0F7ZW12_9HYPO|nr:hypothetical protein HIM_12435 [Hirsutella minnesotensis 3608]
MSITPEAAQPTQPSRAIQDALKSQTLTRDSIIDDSGASNHTFNDLKWFKDIKELPQELSFTSANGGDLVAKAIGTAYIRAKRSDGLVTEMNLGRSVYCPTAPINLLSSGQLRADGAIRDGFKDCIIHKDSKTEMAMIDWINNVAVIRSETPTTRQQIQGNMLLAVSYQVMHERLMHASPEIVLKACEQAGIKIPNREAKEHHCRTCHLAKSALIVSRTPPVRPARPLSLVRIDLIENKPLGHRQFRYTWHAEDAHCGYHWVRFLRHKDELFQATKDFDAYIQRTTGYQVQEYGMDNDVSFNWTTELIPWARANGISLKPTVPGTPRQNGLTERAGSKITQLARCIMIHSKLPEFLWPYAQESVVKVLNLLPCKSNQGLSPHEVFASFLRVNEELHKPYIRHLRTFGCVAYVHIKKERRVQARKMAPRAEEGKLVGWEGIHGKIYHIYVPARNRIVRACDVRFYEKLLQEPQKSASAEEVDTIEYEATLLDEVQEEEAGATIVERISDSLSTIEPGGGTTDKGPSIEETQDHHLPTPEITQELDESHDSSVKLVAHRRITTIAEMREGLEFPNAHRFRDEAVHFEDPPSATASANTSGHKRKSSSDTTSDNASGSKRWRSNSQKSKLVQEFNDQLPIGKAKPSLYTPGEDPWENRIYSCLVVSPAGRAISDFKTIKKLLESMRDAIRAHQSLYVTGNILHRDISSNNIIIADAKEPGAFKGMLIDLDLAKVRDSGPSGARHQTGTMQFMAVEVLRKADHTYRHDLESFFYVLLWSNGFDGEEKPPKESDLRNWEIGSFRDIAKAKEGDMTMNGLERIMSEFPERLDIVKPLCLMIRSIMFGDTARLSFGTPAGDPD